MKNTILAAALILAGGTLFAQESGQKTTIRIQRVENINGVEKRIDTTYTVSDTVRGYDAKINAAHPGKAGNEVRRIIVINDNVIDSSVLILNSDCPSDKSQVRRSLEEAGVDGNAPDVDGLLIVHRGGEGRAGKKVRKSVLIVKSVRIADASEDERKSAGVSEHRLALKDLQVGPNPSSGTFVLSFFLADKGDTHISVTSPDGKVLHSEVIAGFSGNYKKQIELGAQPGGMYLLKISQNGMDSVKKIILE